MMSPNALFDLTGKLALVTGGSRGLGFQIAQALGSAGAMVVLVARKEDELKKAVADLADNNLRADYRAADLSSRSASDALIEDVLAQHGRFDILVNNAGATWGAPAEEYPEQGWDKVIELSMSSAFFLARAAARYAFIPAGSGVILNVASVEGLQGHHHARLGTIAYNTAKGGLINMTRALAAEWGPKNIRVNALAPGFFPSKMTAGTIAEHEADFIAQTPLGKLGGPHDLKGPALLLTSDAGAHITGQVLVVDGGATII